MWLGAGIWREAQPVDMAYCSCCRGTHPSCAPSPIAGNCPALFNARCPLKRCAARCAAHSVSSIIAAGVVEQQLQDDSPYPGAERYVSAAAQARAQAERLVQAANSHVLQTLVLRVGQLFGYGDQVGSVTRGVSFAKRHTQMAFFVACCSFIVRVLGTRVSPHRAAPHACSSSELC